MGLYNRIDELKKLRCDVFLLTKGPPIGSSGGAYIKLIGVPFRKLYDMNEAEEQLKVNRKSAWKYNGWESLCKVVESSMSEGDRPASKDDTSEDSVAFISQKGGTVLVDKSGEILYKHIEDEKTDSWPDIDEIVKLVEARVSGRKRIRSNENFSRMQNTWKITIMVLLLYRKVVTWRKSTRRYRSQRSCRLTRRNRVV